MKRIVKLKEKDLYNIVEQVMNGTEESPNDVKNDEEIKEVTNTPGPKYVMAQEKVDKFGNRVLVEPGTDFILSVFTED